MAESSADRRGMIRSGGPGMLGGSHNAPNGPTNCEYNGGDDGDDGRDARCPGMVMVAVVVVVGDGGE